MSITNFIPYGRKNAITREDLAAKLGVSDRAAREAVSAHRCTWVAIEPFICSDSKESGYWLSNNLEEIRAVRDWYYNYIKSSGFLLNNLDRQLAKLDGTDLVYVRPHYRHIGGRHR